MTDDLIITMGDPAGIGAEIIVKALLDGALDNWLPRLVVAGDGAVMQRAAALFSVFASLGAAANDTEQLFTCGQRSLRLRPLSQLDVEQVPFGRVQQQCGQAQLAYIEWACARCRAGAAAAMITAPIHKEALRLAGCPFPGHTELLAHNCGVERVVMMLGGTRLKVCLVTTHVALRDVPARLTSAAVAETIAISARAFRRYFTPGRQPRIAVLALNPHAGEGGMFGDEEQRVIRPAIEQARAAGYNVSGPHSADTLFHFAARGDYDAVVCMYHDQGLIPLKLLHFDDGVNVTLGLPIIRTSVDHGTAYDLAGSGTADCASLVAAVNMAAQMSAADAAVVS